MNMPAEHVPRDVPADIEARLRAWQKYFKTSSWSHYAVGIIGVAASAFSAATDGSLAKVLAAVSATCVAILGFAQPDRKYLKFARAWRILSVAALRYRHH